VETVPWVALVDCQRFHAKEWGLKVGGRSLAGTGRKWRTGGPEGRRASRPVRQTVEKCEVQVEVQAGKVQGARCQVRGRLAPLDH
jgi:hypothetical protein